ncbi:uncharacterized protein [Dermacentor albipictus]|uniref:uncharacterized protein isoform X2 n=1 Tax=Dermacentor albipictus TaxID=60249 RepID=UPI0038FCBC30
MADGSSALLSQPLLRADGVLECCAHFSRIWRHYPPSLEGPDLGKHWNHTNLLGVKKGRARIKCRDCYVGASQDPRAASFDWPKTTGGPATKRHHVDNTSTIRRKYAPCGCVLRRRRRKGSASFKRPGRRTETHERIAEGTHWASDTRCARCLRRYYARLRKMPMSARKKCMAKLSFSECLGKSLSRLQTKETTEAKPAAEEQVPETPRRSRRGSDKDASPTEKRMSRRGSSEKDVSVPETPRRSRRGSDKDASPTEKRMSRRRSSEKDVSGMEKLRKGRRGSEKDVAVGEMSTKSEKDGDAEKSEKEDGETTARSEKDHEVTEKTDKEASKVSKKSSGSTRSKGSKKGSASRKKSGGRTAPQASKDSAALDEEQVPQTSNADAVDYVKMRLIAAGAVVVVSCLLMALTFMGVLKKTGPVRSLACVSQQCQEVMIHAESLVDRQVKPCRDFYRHVCYHWIETPAGKQPSSFMIDMARNFTHVWHRELTKDRMQGDYVPLKQDASQFYRSCRVFLEKPIDIGAVTQELFEALKLPLPLWFAETSSERFLHNILHLSLVNRFHTLVSTTAVLSDSEKALLIRRESPFYLVMKPISEAHLGNYTSVVLKAIGKEHVNDAVIEEVLKLDLTRAHMVVQDGLSERRLEDVSCPGFAADVWRRALEKDLSRQEHVVKMAGVDAICEDLNRVLVRTTSAARPLYVLALLSVPVITYDYELSEDRSPFAVKGACYRATGAAFEDVWLQLMSSFLSVSKAVEEGVDAYMGFIKSRMSEHIRARSWMSERDRTVALGKVEKARMSRFRTAVLTERAVRCYAEKFSKSASFTSNLVSLRSRDVEQCLFYPEFSGSDSRVTKILAGTDLVAERETLTVYVPVSFAIAPMYYRRVVDDKFVNMAMLGVQLGRKVLSFLDRKSFEPQGAVDNETAATTKGDGWSSGTLANYTAIQTCYSGVSARYLKRLDDSQFDDAFAVVDALRLAYAGKQHHDVDIVKSSEKRSKDSNAAFFKLACLSLCTARNVPADVNTLDFETSYAACLFAVTNLPEFAQALQCQPRDQMWKINRCCVD